MAEFTQTTITVNGQTYRSVDEMPPDVRREYERAMAMLADQNNNGVPDIMEGLTPRESRSTVVKQVTMTTHDLDGRTLPRVLPSASSSQFEQTSRRNSGSGVTIHITWPTLGALLVLAIVLFWWWVTRG